MQVRRRQKLSYVGCTYAYKRELQEIVRKTAEVMRKAGVDFGILGNQEICCGSPILKVGEKRLFEKMAKENIDHFNSLKVGEVVTSCAGCYGIFKAYYPRVSKMNFKIFHIVEYLERMVNEGKIKFTREVPLTVTWHDPCHLGRMGEPYIPWDGERDKYGLYKPPESSIEVPLEYMNLLGRY